MPQQESRKGCRAKGRNKFKAARYFGSSVPTERRLRRILKSNGVAAARQWAKQHCGMSALANIVRRGCDEKGRVVTKMALLANAALRG